MLGNCTIVPPQEHQQTVLKTKIHAKANNKLMGSYWFSKITFSVSSFGFECQIPNVLGHQKHLWELGEKIHISGPSLSRFYFGSHRLKLQNICVCRIPQVGVIISQVKVTLEQGVFVGFFLCMFCVCVCVFLAYLEELTIFKEKMFPSLLEIPIFTSL